MFGQYLIRNNAILPEQLEEALEAQRLRPALIGRILRDLDSLPQGELNRHLEAYLGQRVTGSITKIQDEMQSVRVSSGLLSWAEDKGVVPYIETESKIGLLVESFRDEVIEEAERTFEKNCTLSVVAEETFKFLSSGIFGQKSVGAALTADDKPSDEQKINREGPYAALFRDILDRARILGASDIHLQPQRNHVDIRLRVNGDLESVKSLGIEHRQSFINEAKRLCGFSIAVSGEAQDGRVSLPNRNLDLRTSLIPTQYGEKIVLRLLDLSREFNLDLSGIDPGTLTELKNALTAKNGMLIVSGPTGSGKTTLLYTLLCALDRTTRNIVTLEDPIEYTIPGISQIQISSKLSFAHALRAVLRQDPDVILVGEIRDEETADLCVKAASTGHLVLSTLHANSSSEVIARLINLGIDRYMLKSCLRFSAAQRLIKKLCPKCSVPAPVSVRAKLSELCLEKNIRIAKDSNLRVRNTQGCGHCRQGVVGRVPILEYMRGAEVSSHLSGDDQGVAQLCVTLRQAALKTAEKGETDVCEVLELE